MNTKRLAQQREAWILNVMKVMGVSRAEAEKMYDKIQPFRDKPSKQSPILGHYTQPH